MTAGGRRAETIECAVVIGLSFLLGLAFAGMQAWRGCVENACFFGDAFYQNAVIVRNWLSLGIASFDGVSETSGYSAAFVWILAGISKVFPLSSASFFMASAAVLAAVNALGFWLALRLLSGYPRGVRLIFLAVFALALVPLFKDGSETLPAVPVFFGMLLALKAGLEKPRPLPVFLFFVLAALGAFVAPLSALFVPVLAVGIFMLDKPGETLPLREMKRPVNILAAVFGLSVWGGVFYLLFRAGTLFPQHYLVLFQKSSYSLSPDVVSEMLWRPFAERRPDLFFFFSFPLLFLFFSLLRAGLLAAGEFLRKEEIPAAPFEFIRYSVMWFTFAGVVLCWFGAAQPLPAFFFWFLAASVPLTVAEGIDALRPAMAELSPSLRKAGVILGAAVWFLCYLAFSLPPPSKSRAPEFLPVFKEALLSLPSVRTAAIDSKIAGRVSFYSGAKVFPLDGSRASPEFVSALSHGAPLKNILHAYGVSHVVWPQQGKAPECVKVETLSPHARDAYALTLSDWFCQAPVFSKELKKDSTLLVFQVKIN